MLRMKVLIHRVIFDMSEYFIVNADKTKPWYKGKIIMLLR